MSDIERWNVAIRECIEWAAQKPGLQKPNNTSLHRLMDALRADEMIYPHDVPDEEAARYYRGILDHPYVPFVVAHDWAGAFESADEYSGLTNQWDFRTPYPNCDWEFRLSGKPVHFLTRFDENEAIQYRASAVIETSAGWVGLKLAEERNRAISELLFKHVRAVCISLDAQVSTIEVVRAPFKLNAARERRGRLPIPDYHVVALNRRSRPEPLPGDGAGAEDRRRGIRLHFRRGHWRHFERHKTWIKWTLVGNPDLSFIDKHYRL